mgnify:CR=1 FL=1
MHHTAGGCRRHPVPHVPLILRVVPQKKGCPDFLDAVLSRIIPLRPLCGAPTFGPTHHTTRPSAARRAWREHNKPCAPCAGHHCVSGLSVSAAKRRPLSRVIAERCRQRGRQQLRRAPAGAPARSRAGRCGATANFLFHLTSHNIPKMAPRGAAATTGTTADSNNARQRGQRARPRA